MTYSIVYDAIQIKSTRFEKPASIINRNELTAAMMISFRQAKIEPPPLTVGITVDELRKEFFQTIQGAEGINPKLLTMIRQYPHENLLIDETAKQTYEFGLTY